jgi:outer membrane beta-barrel protein
MVCVLLQYPIAVLGADADVLLREDKPMIEPEVQVNEIKDAKIDDEDFEIGFYGGLYSTEDFGTNSVLGARMAYHITEDYFIEFTGGQSNTRKSSAEEVFYISFMSDKERALKYYNISFGYNILPGEAFITSGWAFYTAFYLTAGIGATEFAGDTLFTVVGGFGFRFIATDWLAFHVDMRDQTFETDVIRKNDRTHNLELTSGITFFF